MSGWNGIALRTRYPAMSKLDDVFKSFYDAFEGEIDAQEFEIDEAEWQSLFEALKKGEAATRQQIKDLILELIGEDRPVEDLYQDDPMYAEIRVENLLKAELRQKVNDL